MIVRRAGRTLLGAATVNGGVEALRDPGPRVATAQQLGVAQPATAVRAAAGAQVAGGLLLTLNRLPRLSAAVAVAGLLPSALAARPVWQPGRRSELPRLLGDLGLAGGLLVTALDTRGRESLPRRARRTVRSALPG